MSRDFLLEVGTEEIPAGYILPALEELRSKIASWLEATALPHGGIAAWATPRRLVIRIAALADRQPDRDREVMGPPARAAWDAEGRPTRALDGFARQQGVTPEALVKVETPRGVYVAARVRDIGRSAEELLAGGLPPILGSLSFPKSMRWEAPGVRFARPVRWLLALRGADVVPLEFAGLCADRVTRGHRFIARAPISVAGVDAYPAALRAGGVVVDHVERRAMVRDGVVKAAKEAGGVPREDEELLTTVSFLVEYPLAVVGRFDPAYLELPPDVIVTALREHQRYFTLQDGSGKLLPAFVVIGNGATDVAGAVRRGAERVVNARLADARFYWNEDRRRPLADRVPDLERVVWQEKLGSLGAKTARLVAIAGALARRVEPAAEETARRAALLAKTDLTTEMIKDGKEFTTLQGVMGEAYARASGEPDGVARAIFEHYLPRFAGDRLPESAAGALVSIADKTDSVVGCLAVGLGPTGAGDPFALRRQAQGVVAIFAARGWSAGLDTLVDAALDAYGERFRAERARHRAETLEFLAQRVAWWMESSGIAPDVSQAVLAATPHLVTESRRRAEELARFREHPDFGALALGFKRVRNILKGAADSPPLDPALFRETAESALHAALEGARRAVLPLLEAGRHRDALQRMVSLRGPIDAFFDEVLVMDKDARVRGNRLALLREISDLFLTYADFSLMAAPVEAGANAN